MAAKNFGEVNGQEITRRKPMIAPNWIRLGCSTTTFRTMYAKEVEALRSAKVETLHFRVL